MQIEHVKIFTPEHIFRMGSIGIEGDRIMSVTWDAGDETTGGADAEEVYAVPGFIDMHLHGCLGKDVCDAELPSLQSIAEYQLQNGVTGFAPATLTLPTEELKRILCTALNYVNQKSNGRCADLLGIHMEGPFISHEKKGAQDGRYILPADRRLVREFMEASGNLVKVLGIAPEQNGSQVIAEILADENAASSTLHLSLAHTSASYQEAMDAFAHGADHVTHLCNAMPVFHHREPGVIGAALDACTVQGRKDLTVELICDGVHVHPAMVRALFKLFGPEHIVLVSDSMRGTGLPDGVYKLGELDVEVSGRKAVLCDAPPCAGHTAATGESGCSLAGSVTNLFLCFQTAVRQMQLPPEEVLPCVTENPAKKLSVFQERGSIEAGKLADILLLDRHLNLINVIKSGKTR